MDHLNSDHYMSKGEAAEYLGLSRRTVEYHLPEIPHFRVGRKLLFRKSELDQWVESYRVPVQDLKSVVDQVVGKVLGS